MAALLVSQPAVSLAPADLRGLFPTVVGVGAHSSRFEDTLRFVYRLGQAGVPTRFRIFPTLGDTWLSDLGQLLRDGTGSQVLRRPASGATAPAGPGAP